MCVGVCVCVSQVGAVFQEHAEDALRYFRTFRRRRAQLLDAMRHLLRTQSAGFLVRAVHDASFMPCLTDDDPLYEIARQLLQRWHELPPNVTAQPEKVGSRYNPK